MTTIDVHTHMLTEGYLELLEHAGSRYELRPNSSPYGDHDLPTIGIVGLEQYGVNAPWPPMYDWDLRLAKMDEAGVDVAIVSLTAPQANLGGIATSTRVAALCNDDLAAQQDRWPDRIRFMAALPWEHPEAAIAELDRAQQLGAVGVTVLANIEGVSLVDPHFAPIWAAIAERELPTLIHPTAPPGIEELAAHGLHNAVGFHFDTTHALERMVAHGMFERLPTLRVIGSHAGGFLPFIVGRIERYQTFSSHSPRDYPEQIFVDSLAFSAEALGLTVQVMGEDNVLFGSDYPHNRDVERMRGHLEALDVLPDATVTKIRGRNAQSIYRL